MTLTVIAHVWFQQEKFPAHQNIVVNYWLNNEFPEKWTGLHGIGEFLPILHALTHVDFYFRRRLRTNVYT